MKIDPKIFKAYDIRGVYPGKLNEKVTEDIARAIYRFFAEVLGKRQYSVGIGRDMRESSLGIYSAVKEVFKKYGLKIYEFDLISTPAIYYASLKFKLDGIVEITASHNPSEYNGLKFLIREGERLIKVSGGFGMPKVKKYAISADFLPFSSDSFEIVKKDNFDEEFVKDTLEYFGGFKIPKIKVVVDTANAMGILYLLPLFKTLGIEAVFINRELDGTFPNHEPDPLKPKNLKQLQDEVLRQKADLGIAPDGDGDRIFFIDEKGRIIPSTRITSLIARNIFEQGKAEKVVVDIRYVRNVKKIAERFGKEVILTRVGHAFITEKVNKEKAFFAGESSGHFYFYDFGGAENSLLPLLFLLKEIGKTNKKVSELIELYNFVYESGEINFRLPENKDSSEIFSLLKNKFSNGKIIEIDGLTVEFDTWRFNFRASNTEPLIRLNLEAEDEKFLQEKLGEIVAYLKSLGLTRVI